LPPDGYCLCPDFSGIEIDKVAIIAAKVNRLSGYYANPTPDAQIIEIIEQTPGHWVIHLKGFVREIATGFWRMRMTDKIKEAPRLIETVKAAG